MTTRHREPTDRELIEDALADLREAYIRIQNAADKANLSLGFAADPVARARCLLTDMLAVLDAESGR